MIAVNIPDAKKGEQIVLLTTVALDINELKKAMLAHGCNPLLLPTQILMLEQLPKLGSGKTDFSRAKQVTLQRVMQDQAE